MKTGIESNRQIIELEFLSNDLETTDEFTELYESMLNKVRITGDKAQVKQMQRILFRQFIYLFSEWRREKALNE
jgi:hypothetical protein